MTQIMYHKYIPHSDISPYSVYPKKINDTWTYALSKLYSLTIEIEYLSKILPLINADEICLILYF